MAIAVPFTKKGGTAIGASAYVQNGHTGSVAIGYDSATTAADQVAFGTGTVTTVDGAEVVTWTNRRSLAGISDIDMAGNISLGGEWKEMQLLAFTKAMAKAS